MHYGNYEPFMEFDIQLNQILPSMGYRTLYIEPNVAGSQMKCPEPTQALLENAFWQIDINRDGTLRLRDKDSGVVYQRVLEIEEGADDGDEYDYSPSPGLLTSADTPFEYEVVHEAWQSRAYIRYRMAVPANLNARSARLRNAELGVEIRG